MRVINYSLVCLNPDRKSTRDYMSAYYICNFESESVLAGNMADADCALFGR